jgi:hypothetical protein
MLILSQTTDKIQVVLGGTVVTNQAQCVASWRDITATPTYVAGRSVANTNNTTDVDLVASPATSTQRVIDFISIYNNDTAAITVTVKYDANGTDYVLANEIIEPGQTLYYTDSTAWFLSGGYRAQQSFTVHGDASASFTMVNATQAERMAGNVSRSVFMVDLEGYTQVRLKANKQVGSASPNDPRFRAKYFTSYTTAFANFIQLGLSQEIEISTAATGYADTGWIDMAMGARINACCIGFTELGGNGVADPALGATDILFR